MGTTVIQKVLLAIIKRAHKVLPLLFIPILSFTPKIVDAQLAIICSSTDVTCNGLNNGSITLEIKTPSTNNYRYCIFVGTTPTYYPSESGYTSNLTHTFNNLPNDTYTATVVDNAPTTVNCQSSIIVSQPSALTWLDDGRDWTCESSCIGRFPTLTGGTTPYTFPAPVAYPNSSLCEETYTIIGNDANLCQVPELNFVVEENDEPPTNCNYPDNYNATPEFYINLPGYLSAIPEPITLLPSPGFTSYTYLGNSTGPSNNDTVKFRIDATNYTSVEVQIEAYQSGGATNWNRNDKLELSIKYEGETTWTTIFTDSCRWEAQNGGTCDGNQDTIPLTTSWISLGTDANDSRDTIMVRCISNDATKNYHVQSFNVRGINILNVLTPDVSGEPTGCQDNHTDEEDILLNYIDLPVTWYCDDPMEFSFMRRWTPSDGCNPVLTSVDQSIAIGARPTFTLVPRDTTLDFCRYTNINIPEPVVDDVCDNTPLLQYRFYQSDDITPVDINWINAPLDDYDFGSAPPIEGQTLHLYWKVTDDAGIVDSMFRSFVFTPEIDINLETSDADFCSGDEATFTIRASGGTGIFNITPISPAASSWSWDDGTDSGIYTTSGLTIATPNITVTYQDLDNFVILPYAIGDCPADPGGSIIFNSGDGIFTVHPKITTNELIRNP